MSIVTRGMGVPSYSLPAYGLGINEDQQQGHSGVVRMMIAEWQVQSLEEDKKRELQEKKRRIIPKVKQKAPPVKRKKAVKKIVERDPLPSPIPDIDFSVFAEEAKIRMSESAKLSTAVLEALAEGNQLLSSISYPAIKHKVAPIAIVEKVRPSEDDDEEAIALLLLAA